MNAWETAKAMAEKHAADGIFVRLVNDKDKVTGVFCGEPHAREVVWTGERYEPFDAGAPGPKKAVLRVAINFFVLTEGATRVNAMKVIEGGSQWFSDVLKVREKYGLDVHAYEIERKGAAGDTKTKYSILPDVRMSPEIVAMIAEASLHDLARVVNGDGGEDDSLVDEKTALAIVEKLRGLPRPMIDRLLASVGAKRVREIKARDVGKLREALKLVEAQAGDADPLW